MKINGTLRNTRVERHPLSAFPSLADEARAQGLTEFVIYWGNVYGDTKGRFRGGELIHTSWVVSGPDENGIIKTRNSVYKIED